MKLKNANLFKQQSYLNGKWITAKSKETIDVHNPFDGSKLGTIPNCGAEEARQAIEAANAVWPAWRGLTAKERGAKVALWAKLMKANLEDLAQIMTLEQGKPITESRSEIDYGASFFEWFAEECKRAYGDVIPANKAGQHVVVIKQSVGVVGAIAPWNFPIAMITRKCAPAVAAGCPVVIKPSELTPFSALALAYLAEEAGIPAGVVNVITGYPKPIGEELTSNPIVRKFSFTGSTQVGRTLMAQCAPTIKKLSLELGGNAPFVVFDDADLDLAVKGAIACKFRNTGQTCVCANRILVQDKVYDVFAEKFIAAVKKLKVGNGLDEKTQIGPLINLAAITKIKKHIDDAVSKGAKIACGGKSHAAGELFFEPTVLLDMKTNMLIAKEETFGPVAPLFCFKTEEEGIAMANDTEFGLSAYFYSQDIHRIWRVAEGLESGMIGINEGIVSSEVAPFGGVKQSGIGREGSKYGLEEYLETKYLCFN